MIPINKTFTTFLYGHKIEVQVSGVNYQSAEDHINDDVFDADALSNIINQVCDSSEKGVFEASTFIHLPDIDKDSEVYVLIQGTWRIVPKYIDIYRITKWSYNRSMCPSESYTLNDFIDAFKFNGRHYFEKFTTVFKWNIWEFMSYIGSNIAEGEAFLTMTMKKVEAYEKRDR